MYLKMEQKTAYPDFFAWKQDSFKTKSGLVFAPEDLYVIDDQCRRMEYYFTWDEAMELERTVLRPAGWRLPTIEEWVMIIEEYKNSVRLRSALNMGCNGLISKKKLDIVPECRGTCGYFWSSTPGGVHYAHYMYFASSSVYPRHDFTLRDFYAFNVRCVSI